MTPLEQLTARMPLLASADHPLGLSRQRAAAFFRAASGDGEVAAALAKTGVARPLAAALSVAKPSDPVQVILRVLPGLGETAVLERALKSAATYPLVLLASFGLTAWAIFSVSMPALAQMAEIRAVDLSTAQLLEATALICSGVLLVLLSALVFTGAAIPGVSRGSQLLARVRVLETAAALVEAQTPLPAALAAASSWAKGATRAAGHALSHALQTGAPPPTARPLLSPESTAILFASAQRGVAGVVLRSLAELSLIEARRLVPQQVRRIHALTLVLAGFALFALATGWFHTYLQAVTG